MSKQANWKITAALLAGLAVTPAATPAFADASRNTCVSIAANQGVHIFRTQDRAFQQRGNTGCEYRVNRNGSLSVISAYNLNNTREASAFNRAWDRASNAENRVIDRANRDAQRQAERRHRERQRDPFGLNRGNDIMRDLDRTKRQLDRLFK